MDSDQDERVELDDLDHAKLVDRLSDLGWGVSKVSDGGGQFMVTFRKGNYTTDYPGMETRHGLGMDEDDAIRKFIRAVEKEQSAGES